MTVLMLWWKDEIGIHITSTHQDLPKAVLDARKLAVTEGVTEVSLIAQSGDMKLILKLDGTWVLYD